MADKNFKVKSGLQVPSLTTAGPVTTDASGNVTSTSTLPINQGGTGQTTAGNALNALLPLQTGNDNRYLQTNGVTTQWNQVLQPIYSNDAPSSPQVGQVWIESDSSSDSFDPNIIRRKSFTATAGQTTFATDLEFIQGYEQVFFNGMLLVRNDDYTTPTNTSVVLTTAAAVNDVIEVVSITNLNSINAATTTSNTFTGNQVVNASNNSIEASNRIRSKEGFRVTGNNGANEYQIGPFYNFTDFQITSSTNNFAAHTKRFEINTTGSSILGEASASTFNPDSSFNRVFAVQQADQVLSLGSYWQAGVGQNSYINSSQSTSRTSGSNLFLQTGGLTRLALDTSGNIQITNQPVDTLRYFDIYNTNSGNNAGAIIRLITNNIANNNVTSVDMVKYRTGGFIIHNNDGFITLNTSGAERMRILSTGAVVVGHTAALNNEAFGVRTNVNIQGIWLDSTDSSYSTVAFGNRVTRANTSAYTFLQNWSGGGSDTEHYLRGDGQAYADGSWNGGGADYAEYFEWEDGNPNNEDRRGYSVSLINDKIKLAEEGDIVFGVVSGNPSVVGDDAPMKWAGKYLKDDFGSYIRDENGYRVLNPEYDEEVEYLSRESRPEWSTIGLMGKLRLRKGQLTGAGWIKMRDVSEMVEEWLVK